MPDYLYDRKSAKFQGQLILNIAVQSMGCINYKTKSHTQTMMYFYIKCSFLAFISAQSQIM